MKIKDYVCKCGHDNFVLIQQKPATVGIYCTKCGKWFKWADKDEKNLMKLQRTSEANLSEREKLAIKAMMYAYHKYGAIHLSGGTFVNDRHAYPDGTMDFDDAFEVCNNMVDMFEVKKED